MGTAQGYTEVMLCVHMCEKLNAKLRCRWVMGAVSRILGLSHAVLPQLGHGLHVTRWFCNSVLAPRRARQA